MLDHVGTQIVPHRLGVPLGRAEEPLHPIGISFPRLLCDLPAITPLDGLEQRAQVTGEAMAHFHTGKASGYASTQLR